MDKVKQWVAGAAVLAVLIVAAGWFLLVSPKRGEAVELRDQAAAQELSNEQLAAQVEALRVKAEGLPDKRAQLAEVAKKIPAGPELPVLLRTLTAAARSAGVELVSVTPAAPAPVKPPAAAAAAPPADGAAAPAAAPAAPAPAATVSAIPLTINVVGDFYAVEQFVAALEDLPRALRVTGLSASPGSSPTDTDAKLVEDGRSLSTTITGEVYLTSAPAPAGAAAATPAAPVPAPAGATSTAPAS